MCCWTAAIVLHLFQTSNVFVCYEKRLDTVYVLTIRLIEPFLSMYCLEVYPLNDRKRKIMKIWGEENKEFWIFENVWLESQQNGLQTPPNLRYLCHNHEKKTHRTNIPKSHQSIVRAYRFKRYKHWAHHICSINNNFLCPLEIFCYLELCYNL